MAHLQAVGQHAEHSAPGDRPSERKVLTGTTLSEAISKAAPYLRLAWGNAEHRARGNATGSGRWVSHSKSGVPLCEEVRVVIPSTIGCGYCSYCRACYYAQCDNANPNGPRTAFFGGPQAAGGFNGRQAEYARIPFANVGPVRLPDALSDDDAILLSDILRTSWFAARLAEVSKGDVVAVFGAGIVGQLATAIALLQGAGRVLAIDNKADRLAHAKVQGAEVITSTSKIW